MKITDFPEATTLQWFIDMEDEQIIYESRTSELWHRLQLLLMGKGSDHSMYGLVLQKDRHGYENCPHIVLPEGIMRLCRTSNPDGYTPYTFAPPAPPQPLFTVSYESEDRPEVAEEHGSSSY